MPPTTDCPRIGEDVILGNDEFLVVEVALVDGVGETLGVEVAGVLTLGAIAVVPEAQRPGFNDESKNSSTSSRATVSQREKLDVLAAP